MTTQNQYDCLILGGGISGVSFAHYLAKIGKRTLILEKNDKTGGQIQSLKSVQGKPYWRDLGAHTCYNSYTHLLDIVTSLEARDQVQQLGKGSYMVFADGKVKSPMSQIAYPSLMLNGMKLFFSKREGKTVKEYFGNIVGEGNYDKLFTRLFRAVLSQNADQYPAESFLKRRDGRYDDFPRKYSFVDGMQTIVDLMIERNRLEIETNCEAVDIYYNKEKFIYKVQCANGKVYYAPKIAFATDPQTTARLVGDLEPNVAMILSTIPLFYSESMNVVVSKEKIALKPVAGIIPVSDEFHSAVSRDLLSHEKFRSFTFHFPKGQKDEQKKIALICDVLKIDKSEIVEVSEDKHTLPSLRMKHLNLGKQMDIARKSDSIYILGNYFYGLSLEDCVNRSFDEAKKWEV